MSKTEIGMSEKEKAVIDWEDEGTLTLFILILLELVRSNDAQSNKEIVDDNPIRSLVREHKINPKICDFAGLGEYVVYTDGTVLIDEKLIQQAKENKNSSQNLALSI